MGRGQSSAASSLARLSARGRVMPVMGVGVMPRDRQGADEGEGSKVGKGTRTREGLHRCRLYVECHAARAGGPKPGAGFRGRRHAMRVEWTRPVFCDHALWVAYTRAGDEVGYGYTPAEARREGEARVAGHAAMAAFLRLRAGFRDHGSV